MENPIKLIHRFNKEAGLLDKGYSPWLESAFLIEEALEGFDVTHLESVIPFDQGSNTSTKTLARNILGIDNKTAVLPEVDSLDKSCDAAIFAIGSMAKLGLTPNMITEALNIVMQANLQKLKTKQYDSEGKLMKDTSFEGPEEKLQALLDRR